MSQSVLFARDTPRAVESETGWVEKFPAKRWQRWALRLGSAVPFILIAIWYHVASGGDWSQTPNGELADRVASLDWTGSSISGIGELYPFLSSLAASLIPGGPLGLGIVGSLFAGVLLQLILKALKRRSFARSNGIAFFLAVAVTPLFAYVATTNFAAIAGLALFGHGMLDLSRFVSYANTQAGFRAGVLFGLSALSDSTGLLAAPAAAAAGIFLLQSRVRSRQANALVVLFPTGAVLVSLAVLGLAFVRNPFALYGRSPGWDASRVADFAVGLERGSSWWFLAPAFVLVASGLILGFRWAAITSVAVTALVLLAYFLDLTPTGAAGNAYVMQLLVAIAITPAFARGWRRNLVTTTALVLFAIGWVSAFTRPQLVAWVSVLTSGAVS